jgi:hypothetical protein
MYPDFKELLSALNAHQVRYLIVGGYAVSFHSEPRTTKDLDILISPDVENSRAVYAALAQFGAPIEGMSPKDFAEPDNFFRMGTPPVMVDILPTISGVNFEEAWKRRVDVALDESLSVPFISREDLLAAKLAAGRPQDLADAEALSDDRVLSREHELQPDPTPTTVEDEIEKQRREARENWLDLRQKQREAGEPETAEERRTRGLENWRNMQERQPDRSLSSGNKVKNRDQSLGPDLDDPSLEMSDDDI